MEAPAHTSEALTERPLGQDTDYWFSLIAEEAAGEYLGLKKSTMQKMRHVGGGPKFIRISARCIRYRRSDLREWAEARLRKSTSDHGQEAA